MLPSGLLKICVDCVFSCSLLLTLCQETGVQHGLDDFTKAQL